MPRAILAAVAIAVFSLAPAAPAVAQPKAAGGKADHSEAKKLFELGAEVYTQGNYEAAIANWEKSYALSQKPLIFENIGNAYERLGNARKAREYLKKWRAVAPSEEHGILDARIKNLDARVAQDDEVEAARKAKEEKAKRERDEALRRAEQPKGPGISVPALALMGGGGAAVIAGVVLDIVAFTQRPASTDCTDNKGSTLCLTSTKDPIKSSNRLAITGDVLWIVGAAAAGAGLALVILQNRKGPPKDAAPKTAILPAVTPRGAGVWFKQTF